MAELEIHTDPQSSVVVYCYLFNPSNFDYVGRERGYCDMEIHGVARWTTDHGRADGLGVCGRTRPRQSQSLYLWTDWDLDAMNHTSGSGLGLLFLLTHCEEESTK